MTDEDSSRAADHAVAPFRFVLRLGLDITLFATDIKTNLFPYQLLSNTPKAFNRVHCFSCSHNFYL